MNLKELVTTPDVRTFKYRDDGGGLEIMEAGASDQPIFELSIMYASPRQYREMLTDGIDLDRKAINRRGIKAITVNEDKARQTICRKLIKGWRLTIAGAYALELQAELHGKDPAREIDFNDENLQVMIELSQLPSLVNDLMTDHSKWFDEPGEDEDDPDSLSADPSEDSSGNSGSGQSGSSDGPPAETA